MVINPKSVRTKGAIFSGFEIIGGAVSKRIRLLNHPVIMAPKIRRDNGQKIRLSFSFIGFIGCMKFFGVLR